VNEKSPIPWLTPAEYAEWQEAYSRELLADPDDAGMALRRAGERTAHLWGIRIAPDGAVVINPDRMRHAESQNQPEPGPEPEHEHEPEAEIG
jgi:hypothetical protein